MKIGVFLKQIPDTETKIKITDDGKGIVEAGIKWIMNPYDEYAIEEAVRLKEKSGGEIVIVSVGPPRSCDAIRQALAMGADKGVHVNTEGCEIDSYTTSIILSNFIDKESFDIIFAGKKAIDTRDGQVFLRVAQILNWPAISPVEEFLFNADLVTAKRSVSGGRKEIIETKLPCIIGCEKGLNEPRLATLPNIMKAKKKEISSFNYSELLGDEKSAINILKYEPPPERCGCKMIEGSAEKASEELVRLLREEMKVV